MRFLLDTHVFLWWLFDSPRMSAAQRNIIADPSNQILVSAGSVWEIATKFRLGRLPEAAEFMTDVEAWIERTGFTELPVTAAHAAKAGAWLNDHRDPFDRMLAAQSVLENVALCTNDSAFSLFGIRVIN